MGFALFADCMLEAVAKISDPRFRDLKLGAHEAALSESLTLNFGRAAHVDNLATHSVYRKVEFRRTAN
jgi:hypothetical protein